MEEVQVDNNNNKDNNNNNDNNIFLKKRMCTTDLRPVSIGKMYHIDPKKNRTSMLLD